MNLKKILTKYAKQDLNIARAFGMVTVAQCKVFDTVSNVDIIRKEGDLFDIEWSDGSWKNCNEHLVIGFMVDAYQVEVG